MDPLHAPLINHGIVIKYNADQKYTTDGYSSAVFRKACLKRSVKIQSYANRNDLAGGGTLGSLSQTQLSLATIDIGCPQWAMHSSYEVAGCEDAKEMVKAIQCFLEESL